MCHVLHKKPEDEMALLVNARKKNARSLKMNKSYFFLYTFFPIKMIINYQITEGVVACNWNA